MSLIFQTTKFVFIKNKAPKMYFVQTLPNNILKQILSDLKYTKNKMPNALPPEVLIGPDFGLTVINLYMINNQFVLCFRIALL